MSRQQLRQLKAFNVGLKKVDSYSRVPVLGWTDKSMVTMNNILYFPTAYIQRNTFYICSWEKQFLKQKQALKIREAL